MIGEEKEFRDRRSRKYQSEYQYSRDNWKRFDSRSMSGSETGSEDQGRQGQGRGGGGGGGPAGGKYCWHLIYIEPGQLLNLDCFDLKAFIFYYRRFSLADTCFGVQEILSGCKGKYERSFH